jgi:hypothetical protein
MNDTLNIQVEEFDAEAFELNVFSNHEDCLFLKGSIELEEEEELWGDQVSKTHLVAKIDSIDLVEQYDEDDELRPYVELELARSIMERVQKQDKVLDTKYHSVNYNAWY